MPRWITARKWLALLAVLAIAILPFAACNDEEAGTTPPAGQSPTVPPAAGGPLKIGLLFSYTGGLKDFGPPHEQAAKLAVKHINDAGGVLGQDVLVVTADDGTLPDTGVAEARRLVDVEKVNAIVGALGTSVSLTVAESVTAPAKILQVSGSSTGPALTAANDNDYTFRTPISDAAQGLVLARVIYDDLGYKSVCTMYVNNAYGQGLSENFAAAYEDKGGTVTAQVPHPEKAATFLSELDQCVDGDPEAMAALSYPTSQADVYLKEAVENDVIDKFVFVDGTKSPAMFKRLGWANFDGMKGTAPGALPPSDFTTAFDAEFKKEYGALYQQAFVRETYDAVMAIALAAEAAQSTDSTAIRDKLRDVANAPGAAVGGPPSGIAAALEAAASGTDIDYSGASGSVEFDAKGDISLGAIEVWHVDAAAEKLVVDTNFKVDLAAGTVEEIPAAGARDFHHTPAYDTPDYVAAVWAPLSREFLRFA